MFLPDNKTTELVTLITTDPSDKNIKTVVEAVRNSLPDEMSVAAQIELIGMAVEPVHPGITERLRETS